MDKQDDDELAALRREVANLRAEATAAQAVRQHALVQGDHTGRREATALHLALSRRILALNRRIIAIVSKRMTER